jgi:putative phosphonate catabolism associated alcohol dehydrogenase
MPRMARAMVFHGAGRPLELREFAVSDPVGTEILVRVTGCTLCGSDLHTYEGRRTVPTPSILGHEILGRIEAFGLDAPRVDAGGQPLHTGDRVTWSVIAHCGGCFYCRRELPQKCEKMVKYGHEPLRSGELTGGLADFCRLAPGSTVLRLPDALDDSIACPANCATATVAAALRTAGSLADRVILVQGAGLLGLTACAMARSGRVAEVICCDTDRRRLERAEAFGATRLAVPGDLANVVARATDGHGVDVAVELSGAAEAFEAALPLLRLGGVYVLVGAVFPGRPVSLQVDQVVRRQLSLSGVHNYGPEDLQRAVAFLRDAGEYPFASVVARWLTLAEADAAFRVAREPGVLRVGIRP